MIFHVSGPLGGGGIDVAFELPEDPAVALAHHVGQDVQPSPVGHSHDHPFHVSRRRVLQKDVEHRDQALRAFQAETLVAHVFRMEEPLEGLRRVEALQDVALVVLFDLPRNALDPLLDPPFLIGVLDVHVLDPDRLAVRVPEEVEDLPERLGATAREIVDVELAVEVPHRKPVVPGVELAVGQNLLRAEWVDVRQQVPTDPVHVDEPKDVGLLLHPRLDPVLAGGAVVGGPPNRLVGDRKAGEHSFVEVRAARQQLLQLGQELPTLGALDHPMVVGAGDADDLSHAEPGQRGRVGALVLRGVADPAGRHDQALAGHEPGHAELGSDGARVGQRDGRPAEVVRVQLVLPDLSDHVLVRSPEPGEVHGVRTLDVRDQEASRAVGLRHIHGQAEVHGVVADHVWIAVEFGERRLHRGHLLEGPDHGPSHQVGEADLAASAGAQETVDDAAVLLEKLRRDEPERRGRGDGQAGLHVLDDPFGPEPDPLGSVGRLLRASPGGPRRPLAWARSRRRPSQAVALVVCLGRVRPLTSRHWMELGGEVFEEFLPALAHRVRILAVPPVYLVDQPHVRPQGRRVDLFVFSSCLSIAHAQLTGRGRPHSR